ncbi:site-specific integrase [Bacillus sp. SJS]|uniref:site-specific integrase n=1 Tax=Bacillus sp. SJS TaxID=1423321 RepID=UPI0004DD13BF|nr:site-specific integrase [Bacillus sp. SJS]KZZ82512.1 integrase [Bacillus sp. SJS]
MRVVQPIRDKEMLAEIKRYLEHKNDRDYILFLLGIYTGLRIADLLRLRVGSLKDKTHITIKEKKTGKAQTIKITKSLKRALKVYLADKESTEYVLKSRQGGNKPISRERAYGILQDVAKEFNLSAIGCHTMRKTFGYHMYQQTKDVVLLQEIFNHSDPAITLRYIGVKQDTKDFAFDRIDY